MADFSSDVILVFRSVCLKAVHLLFDLVVYPGMQHSSVWVIMLANTCGTSTELSVKDGRKNLGT